MSAVAAEYTEYLARVQARTLAMIVSRVPAVLKSTAEYHLRGLSLTKGFRPALVFVTAKRLSLDYDYDDMVIRGVVVQLVHEASLIVDDILDQSPTRRGQRAVHMRAGRTLATCLAGFLNYLALTLVSYSPRLTQALADLVADLCVGEAEQQRGRTLPRPIPLAFWEHIAENDTGGMFRLAARLGGASDPLDPALRDLALLYHGLDDVSDLLAVGTLQGGKDADLRDNIPTLLHVFSPDRSYESLLAAVPDALAYLKPKLDFPPLGYTSFWLDLRAMHEQCQGATRDA